MTELPPHLQIEAFIQDLMGERRKVLGLMTPMLIDTAVGLADQFSVYLDQRPHARLTLGAVEIKEGEQQHRSYIWVELRAGGGPLRMREVQAAWDQAIESNAEIDFVDAVNARRWRFVDKYRDLLIELFRKVADVAETYAVRKPGCRMEPAPDSTVRLHEGIDKTCVVLEIDDREDAHLRDTIARHRLN